MSARSLDDSAFAPGAAPAGAGPRGETILVVDDYPLLCELLTGILRRAGYHVLAATSGERAQAIARQVPAIDLLLTDLEMPGMRGEELASWIATEHPRTKVAFVSSSTVPVHGSEHVPLIAKPFRAEGVLARIRALLHPAAAAEAA